MKNNKYNKIFEIIILGIATLAVSLLFIRLIGTQSLLTLAVLSSIISPLIVIATAKYNQYYAGIILTITFLAIWTIFSLNIALVEVISFGILGMTIGYAFKSKNTLTGVMIYTGLACVLEFILINFVSMKFNKINFIQDELISGSLIPVMNLAVQQFKENEENIFLIFNSLLLNIPAIITIMSFILAFVVLQLSLFIIKKAGYNVTSVESFSKLRLPTTTILIAIIAEILAISNGRNNDIFMMIFSNISNILDFFFMVQGIALVDFFFKGFGLGWPIRIGIYLIGGIIIAVIPILPFILIVAGILDILVDFRKLEAR